MTQPAVAQTDPASDRAWPLPARPWSMAMNWHDLAFLHWPVPAEQLRPLLPAGLTLDTFAGEAWLGIVPFRMTGVRPRRSPAVPWLSAFPELNVRTYVVAEGKPGVWFFSLDATNPVAVRAARWAYHLPYMDARIELNNDGRWIDYHSQRTQRGEAPARLVVGYRATGDVYRAAPGTLDHWLTARYCLYAADRRGQIYRGEIDHAPWPLAPGEAEIELNTMTHFLGLQLPESPPRVHVVERIDAVAWSLDRVPSG